MPRSKKTLPHLPHFILLVLGLLLFLALIFIFAYSPTFQILLAIIMSLYYFFWGMVHHHLEGSLHPRVIWEYLLIALLGGFLLVLVILKL